VQWVTTGLKLAVVALPIIAVLVYLLVKFERRDCMPVTDYELKELLGRGGMAEVHRAIRKSDRSDLAIKQIRSDRIGTGHLNELVMRFQNEADILRKLSHHKNIVTVYDIEPSYIAMELLRGGTLENAAANCRGNYALAVEYVLTVGEAVEYAHTLGIIHRDISLRNLMFRDSLQSAETLVVTDFGLAVHWKDTLRLTMTGDFLGTFDFSSDEQLADSKHVGEPTDVFSLGVVLFRLCTGVFPFTTPTRTTPEAVLRNRGRPAEMSSVCRKQSLMECPHELANICSRCLVPIDSGRIGTMTHLLDELRQVKGSI
jgi:serine/threonine protein kinase